ncbi:MAG: DUF554 domain-containing protein [Candidatus Sumerlaeia bacterium]
MIGTGTIVNTIAVIAGGIAGTAIKTGLSQRYRSIIMQAVGLSVVIIGVSGALQGIFRVTAKGAIDRGDIMLMIFSMVAGCIVGEWLDIEARLDSLGQWFQSKFARGDGNFAEGFVTASLLFCVGAMAIVGALDDGLNGDTSTLFAKSILDGVSSIVFASTMGIGVAFSAVSVLVYQGAITLAAGFVKPWLTPEVIGQMSLVGNVLIMAIGINLLDIKKIKVGNMLPAVFIPLVYYLIQQIAH